MPNSLVDLVVDDDSSSGSDPFASDKESDQDKDASEPSDQDEEEKKERVGPRMRELPEN